MSEEQSSGVSVHAGFPNPAADTSLQGLDLNRLLIQHPVSTYFFRIRGDEWETAGIFDGDIAVVDRMLEVRGTDTVLWWDESGGDFTISSSKKVPSGAHIWGVITATIHQLRKPHAR